jgi:hypothetical protein
MKADDWANVPTFPVPGEATEGEIRWVVPAHCFDQLPEVLDAVPPLPGEEALYQQFRDLLAAADASPEVKRTLVDVAHETEQETISRSVFAGHEEPRPHLWCRRIALCTSVTPGQAAPRFPTGFPPRRTRSRSPFVPSGPSSPSWTPPGPRPVSCEPTDGASTHEVSRCGGRFR